jgi:hypothetical protein
MNNNINIAKCLKKLRPNAEWALDGNTYENLIWLDPATFKPTYEEIIQCWNEIRIAVAWEPVRAKRDQILSETDWVGLKDVSIANEQAWLDYRQALRDIPKNFTNTEDVIWPTKPE